MLKTRLYIKTKDGDLHKFSEYLLEMRGHWVLVTDFEKGMHYFPAVNIVKMQEKATTEPLPCFPAI